MLLLLAPAPRSVLDLGCGSGWLSLFLARAGYQVVGVDISEDAIAMARHLAAEQRVAGVEFIHADYESLRLRRTFDFVLFYDALHHAENEATAIRVAYDALSDHGVLFAFEPGRGHSRTPTSVHAVETYRVHEKDMPARHIWRLGRDAGFKRHQYLPSPHKVTKGVYRRDFLRCAGSFGILLERLWGYGRIVAELAGASSSGLTIMWK